MSTQFYHMAPKDLILATKFLQEVNPLMKTKVVCAIEAYKPGDRNVVFRLLDYSFFDTHDTYTADDTETYILSAEYVQSHPFWSTVN